MLHYRTAGIPDGPLLIFVHGNSQSLATWDQVVADPRLSGAYQLVAVDLPGHGQSFRSQTPEQDYSLKGIGTALAAFVNSYAKQPYLLAGTSIGTIAIAEALPMLSGCRGLFFIGACIIGESLTPADILQPNTINAASFEPYPAAETMQVYLSAIAPPALQAAYLQTFNDTDPAFRRELTASIMAGAWSDELQHCAGIPVALVYGTNEYVLFPQYLSRSALAIWRNEIILVPEAAHSVQLEQPAVIAGLLHDFAADCFR